MYEPLAQDGCDYQLYDGNYYCKRGWLMHRQDVAWGNLQTSLHDVSRPSRPCTHKTRISKTVTKKKHSPASSPHTRDGSLTFCHVCPHHTKIPHLAEIQTSNQSQDSFLNGLTSSIHDSRDNAATRSPSVLYFLDAAPPAEALFTRSSELAINYTLTVDPAIAQFHPDFVAAIRALPATTATVDAASTYDSLDDALKQQLTALIAKYGTHVPEKTTFGGYYALVTAVNEHDLKTALQRGVNLWAGATVPVDGVAVHGNPPADAELLGNPQLTFHASAFKYVYRGGSGGKGKWGGKKSMGGSVPVGVKLVRLSEVIQRGRFPMEGMEKEELAAKQRAVEMAIDKEIGKPIKLNEKRVSVPTFRIRALRMELHEASRHRKSLCGPLYMEPSETLRKFNVDAAAPARYVLFDRPELKPYDWRNGDEYRFREHDAVHAASFRVPLDWFGREEMYVKVYGELMESDKGLSGMHEYRLKPLTIWLGEMDKEEWWVDERFRKVQHVTTGKNVNKADGKVFVYVETDWVLDE